MHVASKAHSCCTTCLPNVQHKHSTYNMIIYIHILSHFRCYGYTFLSAATIQVDTLRLFRTQKCTGMVRPTGSQLKKKIMLDLDILIMMSTIIKNISTTEYTIRIQFFPEVGKCQCSTFPIPNVEETSTVNCPIYI